ncbi:kelch-like protein 33 [Brachyhypopomus gauderio]|uniref:kelch-like protein 33 n=1 Tax=Brachyhypopomus gauderio TaxID=698409 RepID=UPI00404233D1
MDSAIMERRRKGRMRRRLRGNNWTNMNDTEDEKNAGAEDEKVKGPPQQLQGREYHNEKNVDCNGQWRSDDDSEDEFYSDALTVSSAGGDDENSSVTSADSCAGSQNGDSFFLSSTRFEEDRDDADEDTLVAESGINETRELHLFDSGQGLEMEIAEFEKSSDDEEGHYCDDDDDETGESDNNASEECEEDPKKPYYHPAHPTEIFQALKTMRQCFFLTDLKLITGSGLHFQAHSLVLAAVSSVIQQRLREWDAEKPMEMLLCLGPEVSALGLSAVLEFAYSGTMTGLTRESLAEIQTAAVYLGVPRVLELCKAEEEREKKDGEQKMEDKRKTSAEEQMKVSLQSIRQMWEDRLGCDVELEAEGRVFHAHRALLTASSDYFYAMFRSGMRETQQVSVSLLLIGALELEALLFCSYSGELHLNWRCVFELTGAALQFQLQPALSLCLGFMQKEMDAHNCLDVAAFAKAYEMTDLQETADDFVLRHFEDAAVAVKFQDLPVEQLKKYLQSNALCVGSELVVFKAVVSWIEANPKRRVKEASELMATIQFPLMTFKEFKEVKAVASWPQASANNLYECLLEEFWSSTFNAQSDCRTYLPKETLVLVGGERITENFEKHTPCKDIWFSNSIRNYVGITKRIEWRMLTDLPEKPRFCHSVGVIMGKLYVVGGRHYYGETDIMNCTYRYDPIQNGWERLANMLERRSSFALVVLDEKIYAIGGESEVNVDSVEVYCPNTNSWSLVHPLDHCLSGHAASVLNGKIFISGGFDCKYQCLASMSLYHPDQGTTYLADMSQNRAQHCMETFQDYLYVAGGVSGADGQLIDQLACELYDPVGNFWASILPMSVPHVNAASAVLEGKLYILGGCSQEDYRDTKLVHRYDPAAQRWETLCGTPGPNTYIAACVLSVPTHLRQ